MNEQQDKWAKQWSTLLTHCHGGEVEADGSFKAKLLEDLKRKTALNSDSQADAPAMAEEQCGTDENWSKLLRHAYIPCHPRNEFKQTLLAEMVAQQTDSAIPADAPADDTVATILQQLEPVKPRREFQTRLLDKMKERQRAAIELRKASRRRTIFMSGISSMAAAAAVLFVVWVMPTTSESAASPAPYTMASTPTTAPGASFSTPIRMAPREAVFAALNDQQPAAPIPNGLALASFGDYSVDSVFSSAPLPATMRGIGMEIDHGDGWQAMDETLISQVAPGTLLRPRPDSQTAGLGFGDGSTVHMRPDSIIETTDKGIAVRQGTMTVNVPANSDARFYMHFPERDVAVEPGTMLAVTVPSPEGYANGGAPAPVVKVLDGGMAVAKGRNGSGILLANQVYQLDSYVTPELPGRPLCAAECEELESTFMQPVGPETYNPAQYVTSTQTTAYRPPLSPAGFTKKGTRWIAKSYDDETTIRIPYLSDAYFAFANARRDLSVPLSLGSEVIIDGGDGNFYEIHK